METDCRRILNPYFFIVCKTVIKKQSFSKLLRFSDNKNTIPKAAPLPHMQKRFLLPLFYPTGRKAAEWH